MPARGFTLPELLVAVALLAIVSLLAYRGLDGLQRNVLQAEQRAGQWRELARGVDRIVAELRQARPNDERGAPPHYLQGQPYADGDRLTLVRRAARPGQPAQRVGLRVAEGRLELLSWPGARETAAPQVDVMFTDIARFEVRYLVSEGIWSEQWPDSGAVTLPRAIQFRLVWRDGLDVTRMVAL